MENGDVQKCYTSNIDRLSEIEATVKLIAEQYCTSIS